MGQGHSQLKDELAAVQKRLSDAKRENQALSSANLTLKQQVRGTEEALEQKAQELSSTMLKCEEQLASKESAVATAIKKKELAEELRRSDALLAKRIMTAQMKRAGGGGLPEPSGLEGSTMAAQLALAAQDEMQLRQVVNPCLLPWP